MSSTLRLNKEDRIFYVYVHKRKSNGEIFYVGKGTRDRAYNSESRNIWWERVVNKENGFLPEIIYSRITEEESFIKEKELISEIGINNLCNISPGGSGGDTLSRNPNIKEIGKKISEKCTGELNPNKGIGYYKRWIEKYGLEEANRKKNELRQKLKLIIRPRSPRNKSWKQILIDKYGDGWMEKYKEINKKISDSAKNREKILCRKCGQKIAPNTFKRHQQGKNCKGIINNV